MFRKLHIKITSVSDSKVIFKITEQSHISDDFCDVGSYFRCSTGMGLSSCNAPSDSSRRGDLIFVRGIDVGLNNVSITVTPSKFKLILPSVLEYNQTYNKNTLEMIDVVEGLSKWENRDV